MKTLVIGLITFVLFLVNFGNNSLHSQQNQNMLSRINAFPKESLSSDEIKSLVFMREEEKFAQDVYTTLYNKWGVKVFNNISSSEQQHTNAILALLTKYGIADPAKDKPAGVFTDVTLQKLYNELVSQGSTSVVNAYIVGATIEDLDIFDLKKALVTIDNQDIRFVYGNLIEGSKNHLRSFYRQIVKSGGSYTAQHISAADFELIINSSGKTGYKKRR